MKDNKNKWKPTDYITIIGIGLISLFVLIFGSIALGVGGFIIMLIKINKIENRK